MPLTAGIISGNDLKKPMNKIIQLQNPQELRIIFSFLYMVFLPALAQLIVLTVGIYLISTGRFSVGLLVSYLAYATNFYNPLRQLAALWTNFQVAMAGADRISHILNMESNLPVITSDSLFYSCDASCDRIKWHTGR